MATHYLAASPETVRTGSFSAEYPPVLSIVSGDTVTVECLSGYKGEVGHSGLPLPAALQALHDAELPQLGPHFLTGPIAIAGALPGDMLEIRIDAIEFGADWGWCGIFPLLGTIPEDFPQQDISFIPIDRDRRLAMLPWGPEIPLSPFLGVMDVAPAPVYGKLSSKEPRAHGGNLDNKELVAGSTLFLPVFVPGANFSAGDGHGDGEVCVNALEMCLTGTFTFMLHKAVSNAPLLRFPRAESPTHFISMGIDKNLDIEMKHVLREMIDLIGVRTNMRRIEAYKTCSLVVDFHVTQTVNGEVGAHGMLKKGLLF